MIKVLVRDIASQEVNFAGSFDNMTQAQEWINAMESHSSLPWGEKSSYSLEIEEIDQSQEILNANYKKLLHESDWKALRHIGQKALGIQTSLSEEDYLALETLRQNWRASIVEE